MIKNVENIANEKSVHNKKKPVKIIVIVVLVVLISTMLGMGILNSLFSDFQTFKFIEDQNLINVYNIHSTDDGITVNLEAIFSDSIYTYVKISAEGDNLDSISNHSDFEDANGAWLEGRIKEACLESSDGSKYYLRNELKDIESASINNDNAFLSGESLEKNETILIFKDSPKNSGKVNLSIDFYDVNSHVVFNELELEIPKYTVRDLTDENISFVVDKVEGRVTEITYTPLRTQLKIEWEMNEEISSELDWVEWFRNNKMILESNGQTQEVFLIPNQVNNSELYTVAYNDIYVQTSSDNKVSVDLYYAQDGDKKDKNKNLFVISEEL